ncbi:hypothetical protein [Prauserella muralis]|uniref:hypothetical protein n=1 Tax=Prauserella muralis TaxID=588067 RepID=UPI0011ABEA51|nr:hypothetical protein [Prauserella muralis]TWE29202.1 hypothetical protein FHX69_1878 [Prauserella muralis]
MNIRSESHSRILDPERPAAWFDVLHPDGLKAVPGAAGSVSDHDVHAVAADAD